MRLFILTVITFCQTVLMAQNPVFYQIFSANGKKMSYDKMVKQATQSDVVLFGEYHDNSVIHWLQLKFSKSLASKKTLVMGAEMIESDNQEALNQYLSGVIDQKGLDTLARLWTNYKTDYKPLVDFAKDKAIPFIATNIPRRYASMVFRKDFAALDTLPDFEKAWIAPLPIAYDPELPGYKRMPEMMGGHGGERLPKAQAIKDATMAHFILENLKPDAVFLHFNGTYHSDDFEGIFWYLKQSNLQLKVMTIATVTQQSLKKLASEHFNKADFILVVDEDVTKTY